MTFQCYLDCFVVLWIFISYSHVTTAELVCPKSSVRLVSGKDISLYVFYGSGSGLYPIQNLMSSESCTYWCSRTLPNLVTIYLNEPFLLEGLVTEGKEDFAFQYVSEFSLYYSPPNGTLIPFLKFRLPSPNRFAFLFSRSIQTSYLKFQVINVYPLYNYCWHLELLGCHLSEAIEQSQAVPNPIPAPSQSMNVYSFNPKASESEIYFTPLAVTVSDDICSDTTVRIIETSILVITETITRIQDSMTSIVEPTIDRVGSTENEYLTDCAIPILFAIVLPIAVAILFLIVIILTWIIKRRYNTRTRSGTLKEVSNNTLYSSMSNDDETETIRRVRNSLYVNDAPEYPAPPLVLSAPYREFESSQAPLISSSHQDNIYAELDTYKHEHKESSLKYERVH